MTWWRLNISAAELETGELFLHYLGMIRVLTLLFRLSKLETGTFICTALQRWFQFSMLVDTQLILNRCILTDKATLTDYGWWPIYTAQLRRILEHSKSWWLLLVKPHRPLSRHWWECYLTVVLSLQAFISKWYITYLTTNQSHVQVPWEIQWWTLQHIWIN